MADVRKRTKKTRKQAAKRAASARKTAEKRAKRTRKAAKVTAKTTRKAVGKTSVATRAKTLGGFALAVAAAATVAKKLKGSSNEPEYTAKPDGLPNEPVRPANATAPVGAGSTSA